MANGNYYYGHKIEKKGDNFLGIPKKERLG